jgi:energy-coupling factor transporter ATP-binding protein EcfA2
MSGDNGFDVFLSYAHRDEVEAAELNRWLRAQGLRTFFDRSELRPGLRWLPALEDAIGRSGAVAILLGRHGFDNTQQYVRELALVQQTRDEKFPVIPVLMPGCKNLPTGFLELLSWIDLSQGDSVLRQTRGLETLRQAIHRQSVPTAPIRALICPYRGLEPFREEDAAFFCGRDDAIRELVGQVQAHSFVAVVGPSGSGKSSLVFAGLVPALRQQRETTTWDVISFRPGASPLAALAAAFATVPKKAEQAATDTNIENEAAAFRTGDSGRLGRMVARRLNGMPEKPDRLLIYVDQWEELYSMALVGRQNSIDVEKFVALLVAAASDQSSRTTVILTIRADFYAALIGQSLVSTLLPVQQFNVPPMSLSDLGSTIVTPAKKVGLSFDSPALVNQILDDAATEVGQLPLLQFALKEMWESREGDRLTTVAYTKEGGVSGAIQRTAELAYSALTPAQQEAARRLFLSLVIPGEGRGDTGARSAIPDDPEQRGIIDLFSNRRTRLLVTEYDTLQGPIGSAGADVRATVEFAHEALIHRWPRLQAWIDATREKLRVRTALLQAKAQWERAGRNDELLLPSGIQLESGRALLHSPGEVPFDDLRDYVHLSIEKEMLRLDAERHRSITLSRLAGVFGFRTLTKHLEQRSDEFEQMQTELNRLIAQLSNLNEQKTKLEENLKAARMDIRKNTPKVFISYVREDEQAVRALYLDLKEKGMQPWLDKEDLMTGVEWDRAIRQAIRNSDFIVICISSRTGVKRGYIQREIRLALDCYEELPPGEAFLMPVRLEECAVPEDLQNYQYTDLFRKDGLAQLERSILSHWAKRYRH